MTNSVKIELSSFRVKDTLCPSIWEDNETLKPSVREKLVEIAKKFWDTCKTNISPKGYLFTGSLCNYNWSKFSDIDLHILVDYDDFSEDKGLLEEFFKMKKNEWNEKHESLKIYDYPVELYVQDIHEDHDSTGMYSILDDEWIRKPSKKGFRMIGLSKYYIKDKSAEIISIIDGMIKKFSETDNEEELDKLYDDAGKLSDEIKDMRKEGLKKNGEMSNGNVIFKVLRRTGYIGHLHDLRDRIFDKIYSI